MGTHYRFALGGLFVLLSPSLVAPVRAADAPQIEWPQVTFRNGITNTVYQPQIQSWDYATLNAVCAVAVQPRGAEQPTFGTIRISAKTRVDRAERIVFLEQPTISEGYFPSAGPQAQGYLAALRSELPRQVRRISLDRMEASMAILEARQKSASQPVRNDPPAILFSTAPAILINVDGAPVYRPVGKTGAERILNTRALILRDKRGQQFLHLFDGYMESTTLGGPWHIAQSVPAEVKEAEKQAVKERQVDLLAGQEDPRTKQMPSLRTSPVPAVHIRTVATELIVIRGEPQWMPIASTQLLYVSNTTAHVFKHMGDRSTYVLISGRWFRARSFQGPWEFVPGGNLPRDFAAIPDEDPKENVKASIPGTHQAHEALIANSIPSTIKVDRRKARMDPEPQYDGSPHLAPINETTLQYVVNCATPVIKVGEKEWYASQNGVWFFSTSAGGSWILAERVPPEIYSITPSCPLHYVVYSRVYNEDSNYVWVGTTPGYYGTMLGSDGTVVYGTGYAYPPYVGTTLYVCYPTTYGYGSNPCWTPWSGWAFGFAVAWAAEDEWYWWCYCPPAPYWGPYYYPCYGAYYNAYGGITAWGPYGWAGTTGYIYHQEGPWTGVSRAAAGYNAWTGNQWATSYGRAYNSTTGTRVAGQRGAVENVYTGNYAYGGRGGFYNEQTGAAGGGRKVTWGNEDTGKQGSAGKGTFYNPKSGEVTHISGGKGESGGFIRVNDQVIAGKDGTYYRPDGKGGWEEIPKPLTGQAGHGGEQVGRLDSSNGQWRPSRPSPADQEHFQALENEFNARQMGAQRQQSFNGNRPAFRGGGGGRRR